MNILVFSWRDPKHPLAGGAEQVMHEHMKGWIGAGHEVTFFSSRFRNSKSQEDLDGVRIVRGGYQYLGVQLSAFVYYVWNRERFDLVVDQFHGIPFFTPLYIRKPKLAVIQEVARRVWMLNPLPKPLNWIVGLVGFLGEPFVFLFYKRVKFMTGSNSAKLDLIRYGISERNIHVVAHGVILVKPQNKPVREKVKTVLFLGVHSKDKGVEDAIRTFKLLEERGNYQFWTVGKFETSEFEKYLMNRVAELEMERKIKFWGWVSQKKKFELLGRAHVMLNPSVMEGWGLVNVEASAMSTPVISYNSPGLVDSVSNGKSGIVVDSNCPQSLAGAVKDLLDSPNKYEQMCKESLGWSKRFSWETSRSESLELIENLGKT